MSDIKQPEDRKQPQAPFVWTSPDGRSITLKPFDRLPSGVFRRAKVMNELESTFAIIEAGTDEAGLEVVDDLPIGDLDQLFQAWSEAAGVPVPQS